jgi:hypothetical protein
MDDPKKIHGVEWTPSKCVRRLAGDGAANNALNFFERQHHVKEVPVPAERKIDVLFDDTASIEGESAQRCPPDSRSSGLARR